MSEVNEQVVLGIGELLWDCFADGSRPGGAPANVVYHATQLGHHGILCSRIGTDREGDELAARLRGRKLDLGYLQRDSQRPTGWVTVDTSDRTAPHYEIHRPVAWDGIECDPGLEDLAASAAAVCVGTLAQRSTRSRATIRRCLAIANGALTVYDVNLRPPFLEKEWIEDTLDQSRVVKLNSEEAKVLCELFDLPSGDPRGLARHLLSAYQVELVCITRGAHGCLAVSADGQHDEPGEPVKVVDTVGAGDAFTAGLTSGLLRGWGLVGTLRLASRLGALVAGRAGAMPDLSTAVPDVLASARAAEAGT